MTAATSSRLATTASALTGSPLHDRPAIAGRDKNAERAEAPAERDVTCLVADEERLAGLESELRGRL